MKRFRVFLRSGNSFDVIADGLKWTQELKQVEFVNSSTAYILNSEPEAIAEVGPA